MDGASASDDEFLPVSATELQAFETAVRVMVCKPEAYPTLDIPDFRTKLENELDRAESTAEHEQQYDLSDRFFDLRQRVRSLDASASEVYAAREEYALHDDEEISTELKPNPSFSQERCRLLELPAEIRDQIFLYTVVESNVSISGSCVSRRDGEHPDEPRQVPIRVDYLNKPAPSPITTVSKQIREETLQLYYKHNTFEFWRPRSQLPENWPQVTFGTWLHAIGAEKRSWLTKIVLLYKAKEELEYDVESTMGLLGLSLKPGVVSSRRELSEYELSCENFGLPTQFGQSKWRTSRRWMYSV